MSTYYDSKDENKKALLLDSLYRILDIAEIALRFKQDKFRQVGGVFDAGFVIYDFVQFVRNIIKIIKEDIDLNKSNNLKNIQQKN